MSLRPSADTLPAGFAALGLLAVAACAPAPALFLGAPVPEAAEYTLTGSVAAVTDHVIVVSIDGLRPDAIDRFGARTLQRLMREGRYSLEAKTILPSRTLPSHASMFTGVEPDAHGIHRNGPAGHDHTSVASPSMFAKARGAGLVTAAFFSKGKFNHVLEPGTLDYGTAPEGDHRWYASTTSHLVREYLAESRPGLLFVHLGEPDYAGHLFSWMSPFYGIAVRRADSALADILAAADETFGAGAYTLIVTADHGGHGWSHGGSDDPRDVTIPWIAWGRGVHGTGPIERPIHTTDTAATALWLLGVPGSEGVQGRPVLSGFRLAGEKGVVAGFD